MGGDLWYDWKHAMSRDNTSGTMWFYRIVTIICPILFLSGIAGVIAFCAGKLASAVFLALSIVLVVLPAALLVYLIKFNN